MTNFATIKKRDPFQEVMMYCVSDIKRFLEIDIKKRRGISNVFVQDKSLFLQYLNRYYTPRVIEAADAYTRKVWGKHI